ncbi:diguanylate cyclase [Novimethylophilus kurashikiensis]|uniref:Diguanylate cyclase n=1 Tax=Novimethylophilus kurashikiensis TaxID=1825523 RepID=A0A2R5F9W3_9PROT|nr:hypothetical protein [Novimethylophilus kurashikiensis]GBG14825.1 diguanylate cyclase [Novimethylophilus kurashikiensis]
MLKDVYPYRKLIADESVTMQNGRTFRFIAYGEVAGEPDAKRAAAVFDEDHKLVLVDGLFADAQTPEQLMSSLQGLLKADLPELVRTINTHPEARHQMTADGGIPW